MAYVAAFRQLFREVYREQETQDIPEHWKRLSRDADKRDFVDE